MSTYIYDSSALFTGGEVTPVHSSTTLYNNKVTVLS